MTIFDTTVATSFVESIFNTIMDNFPAIVIVIGTIVAFSAVLAMIDEARGYDDTEGGKYWRSKFTGRRYKL